MLGQFFTRHAFMEFDQRDPLAETDFALAQKWFNAAAERYPLHPGIRLWEGDAALLAGNATAAADAFAKAFSVDQVIDDSSVRLQRHLHRPAPRRLRPSRQ